jgi:hypothetical protein
MGAKPGLAHVWGVRQGSTLGTDNYEDNQGEEVGCTTYSSDLERRLQELERQCDSLRRENAHLRSLLGLSTPEAVASQLPNAVPLRPSKVNGKSPAREKITLFRSLFRGRDDVFAKRWACIRF